MPDKRISLLPEEQMRDGDGEEKEALATHYLHEASTPTALSIQSCHLPAFLSLSRSPGRGKPIL
jgi:hypothetical protein